MVVSAVERLRQIFDEPEHLIDLGRAALALARLEYPDLDEDSYVERLNEFAEQLRPKLSSLASKDVVDAVSRHLFEDLGFCGNESDYYDLHNSFLSDVIDRRTGIPITLSIVYLEVARHLELPYFGIGLPGHFMVKYDDGRRRVFVDPFHGGRTLKRSQCQKWLREILGRRVVLREHDFAAVDKASRAYGWMALVPLCTTRRRLMQILRSVGRRTAGICLVVSIANVMRAVPPENPGVRGCAGCVPVVL